MGEEYGPEVKALTLTASGWLETFLLPADGKLPPKRIENRQRKDGKKPQVCSHLGPLLLHASQAASAAEFEAVSEFVKERFGFEATGCLPPRAQALRGVIAARCVVVGTLEPNSGDARMPVIRVGPCGRGDVYITQELTDRCVHWAEDAELRAVRLAQHVDLRWWMGGWGLLVDRVEALAPFPWPGARGLWPVAPAVVVRLKPLRPPVPARVEAAR